MNISWIFTYNIKIIKRNQNNWLVQIILHPHLSNCVIILNWFLLSCSIYESFSMFVRQYLFAVFFVSYWPISRSGAIPTIFVPSDMIQHQELLIYGLPAFSFPVVLECLGMQCSIYSCHPVQRSHTSLDVNFWFVNALSANYENLNLPFCWGCMLMSLIHCLITLLLKKRICIDWTQLPSHT